MPASGVPPRVAGDIAVIRAQVDEHVGALRLCGPTGEILHRLLDLIALQAHEIALLKARKDV